MREDFEAYFNEDGSLRLKIEAYFTNCDQLDFKVLDVIEHFMDAREFSMNSDLVALYYADMYESDGFTAYTLFCRHKDL